ncbi:hypothetical protein [Streptomyces sp. NPDC049590]|uniref:hypothetical protein n=1 Tax=Streptomyces sp. NPDC049590 TaxID=3154834 RepID=UPI003440ECFB
MGIELELRQRDTVVRRSYEHGETLALALDTLVPPGQGRLSQIDPYRDTRFTEQDAQSALPEVTALVDKCTSPFQRAALLDLAEMLTACAGTPGGCLWFIGD